MSAGAIFALNLLLGWTLVGWLLAFIWSLTGNTKRNWVLLIDERQSEYNRRQVQKTSPRLPRQSSPPPSRSSPPPAQATSSKLSTADASTPTTGSSSTVPNQYLPLSDATASTASRLSLPRSRRSSWRLPASPLWLWWRRTGLRQLPRPPRRPRRQARRPTHQSRDAMRTMRHAAAFRAR
jgi:Superinfection immunity protein